MSALVPARRRVLQILAGSAWGAAATEARPQARFPDKPITLLVPFAPGGIADITARTVAEQMSKSLGQPVVVENKPSAGSIVATQALTTARPDGHTLLLVSNGNAVSVGLFKKLPYDVQKDLAFVSLLGSFDIGLFAPAGSRFATLKDVLAFARANPGQLNVGTIAPGSTQHLAAKDVEHELPHGREPERDGAHDADDDDAAPALHVAPEGGALLIMQGSSPPVRGRGSAARRSTSAARPTRPARSCS